MAQEETEESRASRKKKSEGNIIQNPLCPAAFQGTLYARIWTEKEIQMLHSAYAHTPQNFFLYMLS